MFFKTSNLIYAAGLYCFLVFSQPYLNAVTPLNDLIPIHEAFVPKFTDPTPLSIVPRAPPPQNLESVPAKTYDDAIWIPGYWAWVEAKNDFAWICGVWRRPPTGQYWISGSWNQSSAGWIWAHGFWSNVPFDQLKYIEKAPPAAITDKIPQSPGSSYFWAPGYWRYASGSNTYNWLSGQWELSNTNWILAPASYIWRPSGYVFAPFYWDWPLEARGTAYSCNDAKAPLVIIEPQVILQNLFYCYPDYTIFYWHWWHFHPGWGWDGCGCVPPWWHWHDWWFFGWSDCWGLWWWWGHPGAFAPFWLSLDLSLEIAPPPLAIVEFLKKLPKPLFDLKLGDKALLPKGNLGKTDIPLPVIPNNIVPVGHITLPTLPEIHITVPPAPPQPQNEPQYPMHPQTLIQPQPNYPSQPTPPSTYYPPEDYSPPHYTPPRDHIPPTYYPPRRPPHRPPQDHEDGPHDDVTPPSSTYPINPNYYPRTPNYPKPGDSAPTTPNYTPPHYTPPQQTNPNITPNYTPNYIPSGQWQGQQPRSVNPNPSYIPRQQGGGSETNPNQGSSPKGKVFYDR